MANLFIFYYWYWLSIFSHSVSISILQYMSDIDTHYFFLVLAITLWVGTYLQWNSNKHLLISIWCFADIVTILERFREYSKIVPLMVLPSSLVLSSDNFCKLARTWEHFRKCSCATAIIIKNFTKKCFQLTFVMHLSALQDFQNKIIFQYSKIPLNIKVNFLIF